MPTLRFSITIFAFLFALSVSVQTEAQDAKVVNDLKAYGDLSRKEARSLVRKVSNQMKKAANSIVGLNDPIRRAMRVGMFGVAPTLQQDAVNDAKARLYLYSGLTPQTLRVLFRAGAGMMGVCKQNFQISGSQCEALVAASVKKPVTEVAQLLKRLPATVPARPTAPAPRQPVAKIFTPAPRPAAAPTPTNRARYRQTASNNNTAAAYQARRAKYLASFKQKKEENQKAREADNAANPIVISKNKATTDPEVFDTGATETASAAKSTPSGKKSEAKAKPKKDDSFISDLLADPLGKK